MDQLKRYFELVQAEKLKEERLRSMVIFHATACAFGGLKLDDFNKFLDSLYKAPKNVDDAIKKAQELGILEEGNG